MQQSLFRDAAGGHRPTLQKHKITSLHMVLGVTLAIYQAVYQFVIITIYTFNVSKMIIMDHT